MTDTRAQDTSAMVDYRFTLANERTFLAWIRTSLALIGGGVALIVLPSFGIYGLRHGLSGLLIAFGGVLAALAVRRWRQVQDAMEAGWMKRDDVWEVTLQLSALTHGYLALYRGGRFSYDEAEFRACCERAMGRMLDGLKKRP